MILITGAAGFIGSNLVAAIEKRYPQTPLVVCDWFGTDAKWRNLSKRRLYNLIAPDVLYDYIQDNHEAIEMVFHLGAASSTTEPDVDYILDNNYNLSLNLWTLCSAYDLRFVYASSAATYGAGEQGFEDHETVAHLDKLRPLNPYGWSKHLFDKAVAQRIERDEARPRQWAGLKFFNVYGPNEHHKGPQRSVVSTIYDQLAQGQGAKLFKSYKKGYAHGGQLRDFIWVDDCVEVMLWLLENPEVSGLFNVGTGQARSFEELAKAVFSALKRAPDITYIEMPEGLRDKYQYFTQAPMEKLKKAGYKKPLTKLEDGVHTYVNKYLVQKDDPYR